MTWLPQQSTPGWGVDSAGSDFCTSFPEHKGGPPDEAWLARASEPGDNHVNFVCRYLRPDGTVAVNVVPGGDWQGCWSLSIEELARYATAGMAVIPVQFGPSRGDNLGAELGRVRGEAAVIAAATLSLPPGGHLWCDVEGSRAKAAGESAVRAYIDVWSRVVTDAGYLAGLYVGDDEVRPTGPGLYRIAGVSSYWGSYPAKRAPYMEPKPRGWAIRQGLPRRAWGLLVDWDEIRTDGRGDSPWWYRWVG